jgi:hypothetical protein
MDGACAGRPLITIGLTDRPGSFSWGATAFLDERPPYYVSSVLGQGMSRLPDHCSPAPPGDTEEAGMHSDPRPGEDVEREDAQALSRATGGGTDEEPDADSTTGTGDSETFVGRVAGQDVGYVEETGAERRAAVQQQD